MKSLKDLQIESEASFLVPMGDKRRLERAGISNVTEFLWWEDIEVNDAKFTFTPVQHWSARGFRR